MKKILFLILLFVGSSYSQNGFYREYWGEVNKSANNVSGDRWRVNDAESVLHRNFGKMKESSANGLVIVDVPEDLFGLRTAEIYMELWGGHPKTASKKVSINGKVIHDISGVGAEEGNCTYSYPTIKVESKHLVKGKNSLQFSCKKGESFWGHYIIDNLSVRCFLKPDHVDLKENDFEHFNGKIKAPNQIINESIKLVLGIDEKYLPLISSVDYFANYFGYDDNGNGKDDDWHGYTFKREFTNHVGQEKSNTFQIYWNTEMIPDQSKPITFRAVITFKNGLKYLTDQTDGSILSRKEETVTMHYTNKMPIPFWSRDNKEKTAKVYIPISEKKIIKAEMQVRVWDGGAGEVKNPFKFNGYPYQIISGKSIHDLIYTKIEVPQEQITNGWNKYNLISDTKHHGIEMLLPGPCLIIRSKK